MTTYDADHYSVTDDDLKKTIVVIDDNIDYAQRAKLLWRTDPQARWPIRIGYCVSGDTDRLGGKEFESCMVVKLGQHANNQIGLVQRERNSFKAEKNELQQKLKALQAEHKDLKGEYDDLLDLPPAPLPADYFELKDNLAREKMRADGDASELIEEKFKTAGLEQEVRVTKAKYDKLLKENTDANLRRKVTNLEETIVGLEKAQTGYVADINKKDEELSEQRKETRNLEEKNRSLEETCTSNKKELAEAHEYLANEREFAKQRVAHLERYKRQKKSAQ